MTYRTTWRPSPRQLRRQRNKALLILRDQEREAQRLKKKELRKLKPKALHAALVKRKELFTDEEMAEECGCSVEELLAFETQFLDDKRRKWLKTLGFTLLCIRERRDTTIDDSKDLW